MSPINRPIYPLLCCLIAWLYSLSATAAMQEKYFVDLDNGLPAKIHLWYPEGVCNSLHTQASVSSPLCLSEHAFTQTPIVLSHGAMGSAIEYRWLGEGLAALGYIVVGINHFNESWVYGKNTQNPRAAGLIWQRAQTVSAVLNELHRTPIFQKPVQWQHTVMIGHSSGGQTAALLAGARFKLTAVSEYCTSTLAQNDLSCAYAKHSAQAPPEFHTAFESLQQDTRIAALILLDPALGPALIAESLHTAKLPALVIGAKHNDFLPWENHGARYLQALPNAQQHLLTGQEGHFVFLSPCTHDVKVMGIALCSDRKGVDRSAVQAQLLPKIAAFIQEKTPIITHNQPPTYIPITRITPIALNEHAQPSLMEIIQHTPRWVFGLFIALMVLGFIQLRTRTVKVTLAYLLPLFMVGLCINSVVNQLGWQASSLMPWAAAVCLSSFICLKYAQFNAITWDATHQQFIVKGSWAPLIIILVQFLIQYALGVAIALNASSGQSSTMTGFISAVLGVLSGYFIAKVFAYRQAQKHTPI